MEWQRLNMPGNIWALGDVDNGIMTNTVASTIREPDGRWWWRIVKVNDVGQIIEIYGFAPSREESFKEVTAELEKL